LGFLEFKDSWQGFQPLTPTAFYPPSSIPGTHYCYRQLEWAAGPHCGWKDQAEGNVTPAGIYLLPFRL